MCKPCARSASALKKAKFSAFWAQMAAGKHCHKCSLGFSSHCGQRLVKVLDVRRGKPKPYANESVICPRISAFTTTSRFPKNLTFYGRIYGLPSDRLRQRMNEIIELNGLGPYLTRLAGQALGGWKQRLALWLRDAA